MSTTVMLKLPLDVLPDASVAVHITAVVPRGNILPDAGTQVTVGLGSTASVAVTVNVATAPATLVASSIWSSGIAMVGDIVSIVSVTSLLGPLSLPSPSQAVTTK